MHCKIAEATCSSVCCAQFLKGLLVLLFSVPGKVKFIVNLKYILLKERCMFLGESTSYFQVTCGDSYLFEGVHLLREKSNFNRIISIITIIQKYIVITCSEMPEDYLNKMLSAWGTEENCF